MSCIKNKLATLRDVCINSITNIKSWKMYFTQYE